MLRDHERDAENGQRCGYGSVLLHAGHAL